MGTNIRALVTKEEIEIASLRNKVLVVDSYNILYQFLSSIRQRDGSLLMDSKGNVTSHLTGLFHRTIKLMKEGIKLVFVFDGKPPALKTAERERRAALKKEAEEKYKIAMEQEDIEDMKKYASRTSRLTPEMVGEAKALISAFGIPVIDAPSEGEAQAAHLVKKGDAYAAVSQDYDSLLYGVPKLIHNLSIAGKRKKIHGMGLVTIKPEVLSLAQNLNNLGLDQEQLIVLAILVGTDYNIGGVKRIGPKNALKLVKKHGSDFATLFEEVGWSEHFSTPWKEIFKLFTSMPVTDDYVLEWGVPDTDEITRLLVEQHDFSKERVDNALGDLMKGMDGQKQKSLGDFF